MVSLLPRFFTGLTNNPLVRASQAPIHRVSTGDHVIPASGAPISEGFSASSYSSMLASSRPVGACGSSLASLQDYYRPVPGRVGTPQRRPTISDKEWKKLMAVSVEALGKELAAGNLENIRLLVQLAKEDGGAKKQLRSCSLQPFILNFKTSEEARWGLVQLALLGREDAVEAISEMVKKDPTFELPLDDVQYAMQCDRERATHATTLLVTLTRQGHGQADEIVKLQHLYVEMLLAEAGTGKPKAVNALFGLAELNSKVKQAILNETQLPLRLYECATSGDEKAFVQLTSLLSPDQITVALHRLMNGEGSPEVDGIHRGIEKDIAPLVMAVFVLNLATTKQGRLQNQARQLVWESPELMALAQRLTDKKVFEILRKRLRRYCLLEDFDVDLVTIRALAAHAEQGHRISIRALLILASLNDETAKEALAKLNVKSFIRRFDNERYDDLMLFFELSRFNERAKQEWNTFGIASIVRGARTNPDVRRILIKLALLGRDDAVEALLQMIHDNPSIELPLEGLRKAVAGDGKTVVRAALMLLAFVRAGHYETKTVVRRLLAIEGLAREAENNNLDAVMALIELGDFNEQAKQRRETLSLEKILDLSKADARYSHLLLDLALVGHKGAFEAYAEMSPRIVTPWEELQPITESDTAGAAQTILLLSACTKRKQLEGRTAFVETKILSTFNPASLVKQVERDGSVVAAQALLEASPFNEMAAKQLKTVDIAPLLVKRGWSELDESEGQTINFHEFLSKLFRKTGRKDVLDVIVQKAAVSPSESNDISQDALMRLIHLAEDGFTAAQEALKALSPELRAEIRRRFPAMNPRVGALLSDVREDDYVLRMPENGLNIPLSQEIGAEIFIDGSLFPKDYQGYQSSAWLLLQYKGGGYEIVNRGGPVEIESRSVSKQNRSGKEILQEEDVIVFDGIRLALGTQGQRLLELN